MNKGRTKNIRLDPGLADDLPLEAEVRSSHGRPAGVRAGRTRVVIGIRDLGFHQQVLDFLERDPRIEVAGALVEPDELLRRVWDSSPDVAVVCPAMAREIRHPAAAGRAPGPVVVAEEMTVPVLREAIDSGARGVFAWPEERDELADAVARGRLPAEEDAAGRGRVIAVIGARGGAGTTFVASHLAACFVGRGLRTALVDLEKEFAGLTIALGIGSDHEVRTVADLASVAHELAPERAAPGPTRPPARSGSERSGGGGRGAKGDVGYLPVCSLAGMLDKVRAAG